MYAGELLRKRKRRGRTVFRNRNTQQRMNYGKTPYAIMLENENVKDPTTREGQYFRRRFRIPFPIYERLVAVVRDFGMFPECHRSISLELKVMAVLRRLGRGGPFDDCWDGSGMNEETGVYSFIDFVKFFLNACITNT